MSETNDQAGASPAPDRLDELNHWADDLPRRLAGGSDRGITRWAATEIERLRRIEANPIGAALIHVTRIREAIPGRPEDGPYPGTVEDVAAEDVAAEIVDFVRNLEPVAHGLAAELLHQLGQPPVDLTPITIVEGL